MSPSPDFAPLDENDISPDPKMICIILVAGHNSDLDLQILDDDSGRYEHLQGVPKALLPGFGGKKILDSWWELIKNRQLFSEVRSILLKVFK